MTENFENFDHDMLKNALAPLDGLDDLPLNVRRLVDLESPAQVITAELSLQAIEQARTAVFNHVRSLVDVLGGEVDPDDETLVWFMDGSCLVDDGIDDVIEVLEPTESGRAIFERLYNRAR